MKNVMSERARMRENLAGFFQTGEAKRARFRPFSCGGIRSAEREANNFASAFLMPAKDVRSRVWRPITINTVLAAKTRWRVSAMAMAHRLNALGLLSEWQYKSLCIELGKRGYRLGEPQGIERETSKIWRKVLSQLWTERTTKNDMAKSLHLPLDELEGQD
jgi:Zn-dependent peptidase ImmA (M78 family)